jgi:serine/threonine-protein kinase HipA
MPDAGDRLVVQLDDAELDVRDVVGALTRERGRGKSVISFAYSPEWIAAPGSFPVDPPLPLFEGEREHALALDDLLRSPDLDVVRATAPYYRLTAADAGAAVDEVRDIVAGWRETARRIGLAGDELERIGTALTPV